MRKQWKQCQTLFWGAPKSLQMVTAAIKLKDTYSCCIQRCRHIQRSLKYTWYHSHQMHKHNRRSMSLTYRCLLGWWVFGNAEGFFQDGETIMCYTAMVEKLQAAFGKPHKIYTQREPLKVCKLRNCKFKLSRISGWNTECDKTVNCVTDVRQSHQPWQVAGWRVVKNADHLVKAMIFSVVMYGCESWTIKKAEG